MSLCRERALSLRLATSVVLLSSALVSTGCTVGCDGSNVRPTTGSTPEDPTWTGTQSETATTTARSGDRTTFVVAYNDDTAEQTIKYTQTDRIVYPGASLLGWSYSFDRGKTWTYGGKEISSTPFCPATRTLGSHRHGWRPSARSF